jgi:hypothetical protein
MLVKAAARTVLIRLRAPRKALFSREFPLGPSPGSSGTSADSSAPPASLSLILANVYARCQRRPRRRSQRKRASYIDQGPHGRGQPRASHRLTVACNDAGVPLYKPRVFSAESAECPTHRGRCRSCSLHACLWRTVLGCCRAIHVPYRPPPASGRGSRWTERRQSS